MEEVSLDVRVEAGKAAFDDDLMLDAGMQADELVVELDDLHDKEEEYQTVDFDAEPETTDVEAAAESLGAQSKSNDDRAEAPDDVEEGAHDVTMAFNDEIGYEEEEGVAEEALIEDAPKEATVSGAPLVNGGKSEHLEAQQEAQDIRSDLAEPKMGDDTEDQATVQQAGAENPDEQGTTEPTAETEAGLDVDGAVATDALDTAVSRSEQSREVVSEDHQLQGSQNDHDEAIADDTAFSITDITVQYDGGSYALFGNEDMDPETYFLLDTEIATAPLSELLASIRSVIASELTAGEELVIAIESLDLNFGERSSRDFLQRSFHQIIYCYNVLIAKGIVTETSLTLNLVVRPDPEGRFLELLEEAGIWSGADYSPDYSDASVEGEHFDDDQDIEGYNDNEDLENDNDHEDVHDYEFDDQEHQDEDGQQEQEQEENEDDEQQGGLDLTENVEMTEDVEVTHDINASADVPETGSVPDPAGTNQVKTSEERTEPQVTEDVPDVERDAEQVSLEEDIVQSRQTESAPDINGEMNGEAGELAHDPSGLDDVEHEIEDGVGEAQSNLEGADIVVEHAAEMKSAAGEPQPDSGDYTEAINEQEEEEAYNEEEYLEHQEQAEIGEQEDHDIDHAEGAEGLGDDLTLRQTLDDGNFSLSIMEESTEGNAVVDLDDNTTENNDSTLHNPESATSQEQYTDDGHTMDDYVDVENAVDIEYAHETSHLTANTSESKDQTQEGAHDLAAEEPTTHTSTTNTMTGDEIDYDEHDEEDGSFEPADQVLESSNAQGDDDEIGWGEEGDEYSNDSTQQTTVSQDQSTITTKRGRTDDFEEAEEADVKRRRT
ncbi:hypothetical protein B0T20DRAFT_196895 [Sordaria brevicollis]|uniref:Uncharacterized protein n=1 Tax=Sordaria brevicollis TaxID=83679 RepID=A0AAE0PFZ8_SORBR|nr:hypothetical protein B0T20DRAFT_196895 [Sordaria brevicollis]